MKNIVVFMLLILGSVHHSYGMYEETKEFVASTYESTCSGFCEGIESAALVSTTLIPFIAGVVVAGEKGGVIGTLAGIEIPFMIVACQSCHMNNNTLSRVEWLGFITGKVLSCAVTAGLCYGTYLNWYQ